MTAPVLRPYQTRALQAGRQHVIEGRKRIIFVMPTASGKTVLASAIIQSARANFEAKVLFVAHRLELIDQAVKQLETWGVTEVGVIRASDRRSAPLMPVQVASIATLVRRDLPWTPNIIFIDECHRASSDSYQKAIFNEFPDTPIFGLTATPTRLDGKPLGKIVGGPFDALEIAATYSDVIADGFVVAPKCFSTPLKPDLSNVHTIGGDFNQAELEEAMLDQNLVGDVYEHYKRLADGRKAVIFASGVKHSISIVERFCQAGVRAAHIDGDTPEQVRRSILAKLEAGEIDVVSNCQILCEGWDQPSVKYIGIARPTKSLVLYMQMVGRALRPYNDIQPIIVDHGGNYDRHGAPHEDREWSLDVPPKRKKESRYKTCPKCYAYIPSNARECPHCTHSFVVKDDLFFVAPRETRTQLSERQVSPDRERAFFDKVAREAKSKGFKPGYASAKFKEQYERWPPWDWSQELKAQYETDPIWKAKLAYREERRAHYAERDAGRTNDELIAMAEREMNDGDIPFIVPFDVKPRHLRRRNRWERW